MLLAPFMIAARTRTPITALKASPSAATAPHMETTCACPPTSRAARSSCTHPAQTMRLPKMHTPTSTPSRPALKLTLDTSSRNSAPASSRTIPALLEARVVMVTHFFPPAPSADLPTTPANSMLSVTAKTHCAPPTLMPQMVTGANSPRLGVQCRLASASKESVRILLQSCAKVSTWTPASWKTRALSVSLPAALIITASRMHQAAVHLCTLRHRTTALWSLMAHHAQSMGPRAFVLSMACASQTQPPPPLPLPQPLNHLPLPRPLNHLPLPRPLNHLPR